MKLRAAFLVVPALLCSSFISQAQYQGQNGYQNNPDFYNGVRDGGHNGNYDSDRYHHRHYGNNGYNNQGYQNGYQQRPGGIGPGKGALIGGAGGAALGAIFGHGLKGALIGGGVGAGIGAIAGKSHQDHQRNQYYGR